MYYTQHGELGGSFSKALGKTVVNIYAYTLS